MSLKGKQYEKARPDLRKNLKRQVSFFFVCKPDNRIKYNEKVPPFEWYIYFCDFILLR